MSSPYSLPEACIGGILCGQVEKNMRPNIVEKGVHLRTQRNKLGVTIRRTNLDNGAAEELSAVGQHARLSLSGPALCFVKARKVADDRSTRPLPYQQRHDALVRAILQPGTKARLHQEAPWRPGQHVGKLSRTRHSASCCSPEAHGCAALRRLSPGHRASTARNQCW